MMRRILVPAAAAAALSCLPPLPHRRVTCSSLLLLLLLLILLPPPLLQFFSFRFHSTMSSNPQFHRIDFNNINKLQDALFLFHEMLRLRPLPSTIQFTRLLTAVTKMKHYSAFIYLYKEMGVLGITLDEYTLNIAISCFAHLSRVDCGFAILGSFFRRGILPDVVTFNTLLKGLVVEDRVPDAVQLFMKLIRQRVCEPNVVMYGTIVSGLCKTGNTSRAIQLLGLMEEEGKCKPNRVIYNTVIHSLCKDRMVDDALTLFSKMNENCIPPDAVTYNSLVHGLCINGRSKENL
ncbi:hypothetical protein RJ640_010528 [Escallonia rubra]|uniref:Pentatricopeptide repeat-containing protein n=1 Tax=Escallonia rubra TaxID=112253 RepID=A0AA88U0Z5_9ASTE|nr:hypothetical protein RJ640_010528 [Escallonia rubra]